MATDSLEGIPSILPERSRASARAGRRVLPGSGPGGAGFAKAQGPPRIGAGLFQTLNWSTWRRPSYLPTMCLRGNRNVVMHSISISRRSIPAYAQEPGPFTRGFVGAGVYRPRCGETVSRAQLQTRLLWPDYPRSGVEETVIVPWKPAGATVYPRKPKEPLPIDSVALQHIRHSVTCNFAEAVQAVERRLCSSSQNHESCVGGGT